MLDTLGRDRNTTFQLAVLNGDPGPAAALLAAGSRAIYCLSANPPTALFLDMAAFMRSVGEFVQ